MKRCIKSSNSVNELQSTEEYFRGMDGSIELITNSYNYIVETFELEDEDVEMLDNLSVRAVDAITEYAIYFRNIDRKFER